MKTTLLVSVLLASAFNVLAHPLNKRAEEVVWVTDWVTAYETVGYTTTIWVEEGSIPSSKSAPAAKPTSTAVPAQFFEPSPAQPKTTAVPEAPAPTTQVQVQAPAPAPTSISSPAPAPAPANPSPSSGGSSVTGECSPGSPCQGDMTYYEAGLGACGWTNNGNTERVVALPVGLMGPSSNGNPFCGRMITVKHNGKTTTAKVVDKCPGCKGYTIDLSNAAFLDLADLEVGRTAVEWYFTT